METHRLQLLDFPGSYEDGMPYDARTRIAIKTCSRNTWRNRRCLKISITQQSEFAENRDPV